jgi:hypothetical protein
MAIQGVNAFKTTDGKVFLTEVDAIKAEHEYDIYSTAYALAESIRPPYTDGEEVAKELVREEKLVLRLADAMRAAKPQG